MEKVVSDEFNENDEYGLYNEYNENHEYYYYYFPTELYTDENNNLLPNKLTGAYSEFESFIKSNKIPEYAREYKREYQFIRGLNKELGYFREDRFDDFLKDKIVYLIKKFLGAQEKGKFKEINELYFWKSDILNIIEFENGMLYDSYVYYYDLGCDFLHYFNKFYDKINFKYYDWDGNIKVKEDI